MLRREEKLLLHFVIDVPFVTFSRESGSLEDIFTPFLSPPQKEDCCCHHHLGKRFALPSFVISHFLFPSLIQFT